MDVVLDLHYLPCLDYFLSIHRKKCILVDTGENYIKQSYRNRTYIKGPHKIQYLTVPVMHGKGAKIKMKDVRIDYDQNWLKVHLRSIQSAYGNAPYFDYFIDPFLREFEKKQTFLADLNYELLTLCLKFLNWKIEVKTLENSEREYINNRQDLRYIIHPKKPLFNKDIIASITYTQVFGNKFANNLSILDLLFCQGSNADKVISDSIK